jgi:hypothetical protein
VSARLDMVVADAAVSDRLDALVARGILLEDAGRVLSLAVPLGDYIPAPSALARFYRLLAVEGRRGVRGARRVAAACRGRARSVVKSNRQSRHVTERRV